MKSKVLIDLRNQENKYEILAGKIKIIGRHTSCDIVLELLIISKRHATLEHTVKGLVFIWDNNSKNGTYYERKGIEYKVTEKTQLFEDDILKITSSYTLRLESRDTEAEKKAKAKKSTADTSEEIKIS